MSIPLAEAFRFCPRCGAAVENVGGNPLQCGQCAFAYYFTPVTGVVGIIAAEDGRVLLLQRARDPGRGLWGLPGGFVDPGESADEALIREVREEVGLTAVQLNYLGSFANRYDYRGVVIPVTDVIYTCTVESHAPLRVEPEEIQEAVWLHPGEAELSRMAFTSNRRALELYLAGR